MNEPRFKIAELYEKTSRTGARYFTGRLHDGVPIFICPNQCKRHADEPDWFLFIQERSTHQPTTAREQSTSPCHCPKCTALRLVCTLIQEP